MSDDEKVGVLTERIDNLIDRWNHLERAIETRFVTRAEFTPIQRLVYGGVGLVLTMVVAAVVALAVKTTTL